MQITAIAVLIIIAGLIGALLACVTSLINRVRAANTTLRRIEEALLSLNRVKAIDSAVKSAEPVKQSQPADADTVGFLTVRELKMMSKMSSRDRQSAASGPVPNGRKPLRTSVTTRKAEDTGKTSAEFAKREPSFEASESPNGLDPTFEISWPRPDHQMPNMDLRKGMDEAIVHGSQMFVAEVAHTVVAASGELLIQKASEAVEETRVAISPLIRGTSPEVSTPDCSTLRGPNGAPNEVSAVVREVPEVGQGGQTAPTSNALEESRRKKKEQELRIIMSSRRRRARAGR